MSTDTDRQAYLEQCRGCVIVEMAKMLTASDKLRKACKDYVEAIENERFQGKKLMGAPNYRTREKV